jgi:hypothetical protein
VQCSTAQRSAVQCSAVQCSAGPGDGQSGSHVTAGIGHEPVDRTFLHCTALHCTTVDRTFLRVYRNRSQGWHAGICIQPVPTTFNRNHFLSRIYHVNSHQIFIWTLYIHFQNPTHAGISHSRVCRLPIPFSEQNCSILQLVSTVHTGTTKSFRLLNREDNI